MATQIRTKVGQKINGLTLIKRLKNKNKDPRALYLCDCGKTKKMYITFVNTGRSKTCGCKQGHALPFGVASASQAFAQYKRGAKRRSLKFNLSLEDFLNLTCQRCYYCDKLPSNVLKAKERGNGDYIYNGIDRINNSKGYSLNNCVPCCNMCNKGKWIDTSDNYIKRCYAVVAKHYFIPDRRGVM